MYEKFTLVDLYTRTSKDKTYYLAVLYSSYKYVVNVFITEQQFKKLKDFMYKEINSYLSGFYDNKTQKMRFIINI